MHLFIVIVTDNSSAYVPDTSCFWSVQVDLFYKDWYCYIKMNMPNVGLLEKPYKCHHNISFG